MALSAKETVIQFLEAMNNEEFDKAREYVNDDLKFIGVMGTRDNADTYFQDMKKMKFKYDIKKVLADDTDVSVFYDINMSGNTIFTSGWYYVKNGKIAWFKVLFDPRPLLEHAPKK
jgi:limonene-1,2-epoxide hydrolase